MFLVILMLAGIVVGIGLVTITIVSASRSNRTLIWLLVPLLAYIVSLFLPAIRDSSLHYGIEVLLWGGWFGPIALYFGWYANILFFMAIVAAAKNRIKLMFYTALFGAVLSLDSFRLSANNSWSGGGGDASLEVGAYVWVAAIWLLLGFILFGPLAFRSGRTP